VTADWLLEKERKRFPELAAVVEKYGDRGRRWLERQSKEIALYLTGQLVYDARSGKMVEVRRVQVERA